MRMLLELAGRLARTRRVRVFARLMLGVLAIGAVGFSLLSLIARAQRPGAIDAKREVSAQMVPSHVVPFADGLVIGSRVGELRLLDAATGKTRVKTSVPGAELHALVAHGSSLFAAEHGRLVRFNGLLEPKGRRPLGRAGVRRLASGPFGLFALQKGSRSLVRIHPGSLTVQDRLPATELGGPPTDVIVTRSAAWVLVASRDLLVRVVRREGRLRVDSHLVVPRGSRRLARGGGVVAVLSPRTATVLLVRAADIRDTRSFRVERGALDIAIGNSSLWVLSSDDNVSQRRLSNGTRVGNPIGVEPDPTLVRANLHAVWTASAGSGVLTRLDLRRLPALRSGPGRPTIIGFDRWLVLGLAVFCLVAFLGGLATWNALNPYRFIPRYPAGVGLRLFALNEDQAGWLLKGRRRKRTRGGKGRRFKVASLEADTASADADELDEETLEETLHRRLLRGLELRVFSRDLGWLRPVSLALVRRTPRPRHRPLWERHELLEGCDCLVDGHSWDVTAGPADDLFLVSTGLRDPHRPKAPLVPVPHGAAMRVRVRRSDLRPLGGERLIPGGKILLDLIVTPVPAQKPAAHLDCELVMAFQVVPHARSLRRTAGWRQRERSARTAPHDRTRNGRVDVTSLRSRADGAVARTDRQRS